MLVNNIVLFIKKSYNLRWLVALSLITLSSISYSATLYVSPSGNNNNQGTIDNPWQTWLKAFEAAKPGDTVFFRGGVYPHPLPSGNIGPNSTGLASAWIYFLNYPGEVPILDCSNKTRTNYSYALYLNTKSYIYFRGLHFRNNKQLVLDQITGGTNLYRCDNITFDNCKSYGHGYTGFSDGLCDNILYKNCDAYGNYNINMTSYSGGGSDGFYTTASGGSGTIKYVNCRAWHNSDDGWDSMYNDGLVIWNGCWSMSNGYDEGDGTGYKLGHINSCNGNPQRQLTNCISINNKWSGYNENNNGRPSSRIDCYNNVSFNDMYGFMNLNSSDDKNQRNYRNNIAYNSTSGSTYLFNEPNVIDDHNSWNHAYSISTSDFVSLDTINLYGTRNSDGTLPLTDFMKLNEGSSLIDAGTIVGLPFYGSAPDLGWHESSYDTNSLPVPSAPIYVSSVIENATPARLEMTYNPTLANIIPATTFFVVKINNITRNVTSVTISGTKVLLTLASPVLYGDAVTVAYTKPASNPLQTTAGGQAASISAQNVTNSVAAINPMYVSAVIQNSTPARLEMTYNLTLAKIIPATTAFAVRVNNVTRNVTLVTISGTKVLLTLASPLLYGDAVTVAYTKPASNPLQTTAGGQAASISAQNVTNNVAAINPSYVSAVIQNATPARLEMTYNLTLANIIPATTFFVVKINNITRNVTSVTISGTKVLLTLASPVLYGEAVTVAYTKPASNPLQTTAGGQAATIAVQTVTNNVDAVNYPPVVTILSPTKSTSFIAPTTIAIDALASDPNGNLSKVEFYQGAVKIGELLPAATYSFIWKEVSMGTYSLTAVAIDAMGLRTVSTAVSVTVEKSASTTNQLPVVSITLANNRRPKKHENVIILAEASDPDGTISKIELKSSGGVTIAELTSAPYIFTLTDVDTGSYEVQAIAVDNIGAISKSATLKFFVENSFDYNSDMISLYPNPNDGNFNIKILSDSPLEDCRITIINLSGQPFYKEIMNGDSYDTEVNLQEIPSAVYVVIFSSGKTILSTKKFIKS